jgi:hypothetical protein
MAISVINVWNRSAVGIRQTLPDRDAAQSSRGP